MLRRERLGSKLHPRVQRIFGRHRPPAVSRRDQRNSVTAVATEMELPFASLRSKHAHRCKSASAAKAAPPAPDAGDGADGAAGGTALAVRTAPKGRAVATAQDDYIRPPVRMAGLDWSLEADAVVAAAREEELPRIAADLGLPVAALHARRDAIARQVAKEMADV